MTRKPTNTKAAKLAKLKRELKLLIELQAKHGYMLSIMLPKRDRFTTQVKGFPGANLTMTPAVACKLIVPEGSALGRRLVEGYRNPPTISGRKSKRKR